MTRQYQIEELRSQIRRCSTEMTTMTADFKRDPGLGVLMGLGDWHVEQGLLETELRNLELMAAAD